MHIIITYEGFKNEWTGETLENCVLHHGNLSPNDDFVFGYDYWVQICESYKKMGYNKIRAVIADVYKLSFWEENPKHFNSFSLVHYEPKVGDLVINF